MTTSVSGITPAPVDPRDAAMRKAATDLQGVFVQELYKTMRASVDSSGGLVEQGQGEAMFAGLMDERLAADTGTRWHRGLGDAIYRALREKAGLGAAPAPHAAPVTPSVASPVRIP
ncbi:MAG: rod-binding protein [Gemmatimonadaceae bacterium]|nr:rod-binding protein [Gemmatimonadaceae bacterium]